MNTAPTDPQHPTPAPIYPAPRPINLAPPIIAALAAMAVASIGGRLTDLGPWYIALSKPFWQPPGVAFPIVWTAVFTLTAIAGVLGWRRGETAARRRRMAALFAVNGGLNIAWSGLFFTLQRPDWALYEVGLLWASILALILHLWPYARPAAWLLTPYLLWVSIAAVLNWEIVRLNGPFVG